MTSDALPALNVIIALIGCAVGHDCARAATGANRTTRTTIDVRMRDMPLPPSHCLCSRIFSTGDGHCAWGIWPALSVLRTQGKHERSSVSELSGSVGGASRS